MYFIIGFILVLFCLQGLIDKSQLYKNVTLIVGCVIMLLFVSLRDGSIVGTDSPAYFDNYKYNFWTTEFGYKYLNLIFSEYLQVNYTVFLFFINGLSLFLMYHFIQKNAGYKIIALLIFFSDLFLYFNFSGIRQGLATSFTCFSVIFAVRKQFKLFLICIFFASMFHITSIVFLCAYFIPRKSFSLKNIMIIGLIIFLIMFIANNFIGSIEYLSKKADYYTNIQERNVNIASLFFVGLVKRFIIIGVILLLRNRLFNDENFVYYFNLYLIGFVIYAGTYMISPDFGVRFSSYYTIMDTILVGNIIFLVKSKPIKIAVLLLFCGLSVYKVSTYAIVPTYEYRSIL